MNTELTFYAGIHTIGGVVLSIVHGGHRVLLEIGTAYEPKTDVYDGFVRPRLRGQLRDELLLGRAPLVDGLYSRADMGDFSGLKSAEETALHTAAFVSHLHLDHMSCMGLLSDRVDVYLSEPAQRIEAALETTGLGSPSLRSAPYLPLYDRQTVCVGEIRVTPFLLCAASYQDWSFYVETPDLTLHYTGDLMMHGDYRDAVLAEMAWVAARKPDILVCEATTFMDSTLRMVYGRTDAAVAPSAEVPEGMLDKCGLDRELEKLLEAQRGLCVINFYQREMADAAAFREMARRCGRTLALEPETAYVAWRFFGEPVHVYIPDNERFAPGGRAAGAAWYRDLLANNPTVTLEQLRAAPQAYVVQNSYENLLELFSLPDAQGSYLHAGGAPIGAYDPRYQNLLRVLERTAFRYVTFFAENYFSHAYPCQVKYYVDQIDPRVLIPSHSENPERLLPGAHGVQFIPRLGTTYLYQAGRLVEKE